MLHQAWRHPSLRKASEHVLVLRECGGAQDTRWIINLCAHNINTSKKVLTQFGGVPTTPDPNTSAKASQYKWEAYRDANGGVKTTFYQGEGILLQKCRYRSGRCIAILFKSIGVRGRFDSPD